MGHTYALGAVKPHVRSAADDIGNRFDVSTIYGVGARAGESDHPKGLALDFMVYTDKAKGDQIAAYVKQNWGALAVKYIIWQQRIDEGSGWKAMEDRGGTTANHMDHDHVSFLNAASGPAYAGQLDAGTAAGGSAAGGGSLAAFTTPSTWIRVMEFVAGVVLIIIAFWPVVGRMSGGIL
jgi:hypothetical protein